MNFWNAPKPIIKLFPYIKSGVKMAYLSLLWYGRGQATTVSHRHLYYKHKGFNYCILRRVNSDKRAPSTEQEKSKRYLKWASCPERELSSCNILTWSWKLNHAPSCAGRQEAPRGPPTEPDENYFQVPCLAVSVTLQPTQELPVSPQYINLSFPVSCLQL